LCSRHSILVYLPPTKVAPKQTKVSCLGPAAASGDYSETRLTSRTEHPSPVRLRIAFLSLPPISPSSARPRLLATAHLHTHPLSLSLSLTHSHTHTHTHTHTVQLTHSQKEKNCVHNCVSITLLMSDILCSTVCRDSCRSDSDRYDPSLSGLRIATTSRTQDFTNSPSLYYFFARAIFHDTRYDASVTVSEYFVNFRKS